MNRSLGIMVAGLVACAVVAFSTMLCWTMTWSRIESDHLVAWLSFPPWIFPSVRKIRVCRSVSLVRIKYASCS